MDIQQIIQKNRWVIGIFIIALAVRIFFVFSSPLKIWDETVYANLGYDLSKNPFDYSVKNNGWSDFIPSGGDSFYAWPKIGFRAPLLPYSLAILYFLNLNFLINFFVPIFGALTVVLLYYFGKRIFNEKVAVYSAFLFSLIPVHGVYSGKILTDVFVTFFVVLTFISFWKGYEEENKKYKVLFGVFFGLSLLSRYTTLWIAPIFLIYFLIRDKSLAFLKDKYLWYAVLAFFIILTPGFIYGISEYSNPLGAFIHGGKASGYWGGVQSWHFFFQYWWHMFSIIGFLFIFSLAYIFYTKTYTKKEIYILLIWILFFFGMAILMPHKEDRFIIPITPAICLISGFFFNKIKKYKKIFLIILGLILLSSLTLQFTTTYKNSYTETNICFLEANKFLNEKEDSLIITDESPIVYFYTKKETCFYPNPWSVSSLKNIVENYKNKSVYVLFTDFDMPLNNEKNVLIKKDLDKNFEIVFDCVKGNVFSFVYKC